MRGYFASNNISEEEKSNILSQHKTLYNGYQTLNPEIPNTQPLYVQDFAKDKTGAVMGNKGNIKGYTNMGINEQSFPYDKPIVSEGECSECGGMMQEGECSECGWKGGVGNMEERFDDDMEFGDEVSSFDTDGEFLGAVEPNPDMFDQYDEMEEGKGHLDDIYDEEDLNPNASFDYVKGATNKTNAFHVKEQMMTAPIGKISAIGKMEEKSEMDEQGGNADDPDVTNVKPAYDFVSDGPMDGGDVYPVNELDEDSFDDLINADSELEYDRDNLEQEGYETMESAWADEVDEVDISGSQGVYGDMKPAFDFDSEGPGKGGPYQEYHGQTVSKEDMEEQQISRHIFNKMKREKNALSKGEDFDDSELDITDYEGSLDPKNDSWQDITKVTGDDEFGYVDEDIRESFIHQKNRIMEMMNRMKVIK